MLRNDMIEIWKSRLSKTNHNNNCIIIVCDLVLTRTSPVSLQDFFCCLLAGEFLLFSSVLYFAFMHLLSGYCYYDYVVIGQQGDDGGGCATMVKDRKEWIDLEHM